MKYVTSRIAASILGVHPNSLRSWEKQGKIRVTRTPGGKRLYDIESFTGAIAPNQSVCYCRVSSQKQRDDLERQVAYMRERFPEYDIITDIASGLNFKRKGLRSLLERVLRREVKTVVVFDFEWSCFSDDVKNFFIVILKIQDCDVTIIKMALDGRM